MALMDPRSYDHPTEETLSLYGLGKLDGVAFEAVDKHLDVCVVCRDRLSELSADSFLERVRAAGQPTSGSTSSAPDARQAESKKSASPAVSSLLQALPPGLADHPDYEVKRELGRGGMGVVYLVHNKMLGRDEVIKVIGKQISELPRVLERFLREIRAVAKLRHPNIVTAYHAARLGESIIFAMEYVEGRDLSQLVKSQGSLPVARACNFAYQAAIGLQHAHEELLVHRDIKPSNLMLARKKGRSTVKILDFGLAKATREQGVDSALTREGQALGTPDFIAPEQILDATNVDIRADIYSLGGTLYYLLTGRPPFVAKSLYDIYQAHISQNARPLNLVRPEVSSELAALVAKMMAKDPDRRFQTPGDLAQSLKPFFQRPRVQARITDAEISQQGRLPASPPENKILTASPESPTDVESAVPKPTKTPTTSEQPQWESLIELRETERSIEPAPFIPSGWPPRWLWPTIAAGLLLLGLFAVWQTGVIRVKTPNGIIEIKNYSNDFLVEIDDHRVNVIWPGGSKPARLEIPVGDHKLRVTRGEEQLLSTKLCNSDVSGRGFRLGGLRGAGVAVAGWCVLQ